MANVLLEVSNTTCCQGSIGVGTGHETADFRWSCTICALDTTQSLMLVARTTHAFVGCMHLPSLSNIAREGASPQIGRMRVAAQLQQHSVVWL
jgi:hypothetical protein